MGTAKGVEATAAMEKSEVARSTTEGLVDPNDHDTNVSTQTVQDKSGNNGTAKSADQTDQDKSDDIGTSKSAGQTDQDQSGDKTIEVALPIGAAASQRTYVCRKCMH